MTHKIKMAVLYGGDSGEHEGPGNPKNKTGPTQKLHIGWAWAQQSE